MFAGETLAPGVDLSELYRLKERRFPMLTDPPTVPTSEVPFGEDHWVVGLAGDWGARAYPVAALAKRHLVNDTTHAPVLVTFCVMCSSGICFDPVIESERFIFDVFGHYRLNMAMKDQRTGTVWSQMDGAGIVGELAGSTLPWVTSATMPARQWLERHPDSQTPTAMRPGQRDDAVTLGLSADGSQGHNPLVLGGVIAGLPVAYRVESRPTGPRAVGDTIAGEQIVILADRDATPAMYRSRLGSEVVDFEVADGQIVGGGSTWSGEGKALDGPLLGQRLTVVPSHMTRWLQWQSFHPDVEMRRPPAPSR